MWNQPCTSDQEEGEAVKQKLSLLVAGTLVGAAFMAFVPANAHHAGNFRSVSRRAAALERQVSTLQRQVRTLNARTQALDSDGFYNGPLDSEQVLSVCPAGQPAAWEQLPQVSQLRRINNCAAAPAFGTRLSERDLRRFARR